MAFDPDEFLLEEEEPPSNKSSIGAFDPDAFLDEEEPVAEEPQIDRDYFRPKPRKTEKKKQEIGTFEGISNAAKNAFDSSRQAMDVIGGVSPEEAQNIAKIEFNKKSRKLAPGYDEYQKAEGWDAVFAFAKNPIEVTSNIIAEGLAGSLPALGAGLAAGGVGAAAGSVVPVLGTGAGFLTGQVAGTFAGSLATEYGGKVLEELQGEGMDITDPNSIQAFFGNEELVGKARNKALKRGVPIAAFDALSAGIGGKLGRVFGTKVLTEGEKIIGKQFATKTGEALTELGVQAGLGGGGEVAGSLVAGDPIEGKAVFGEIVGEVGPGSIQVLTGKIADQRAMAKTREDAKIKAAADLSTTLEENSSPLTASVVTARSATNIEQDKLAAQLDEELSLTAVKTSVAAPVSVPTKDDYVARYSVIAQTAPEELTRAEQAFTNELANADTREKRVNAQNALDAIKEVKGAGLTPAKQAVTQVTQEGQVDSTIFDLQSVANNTATREQISSLSLSGLVDIRKGQAIINEDGEGILAQAQAPLPKLTPEERSAEVEATPRPLPTDVLPTETLGAEYGREGELFDVFGGVRRRPIDVEEPIISEIPTTSDIVSAEPATIVEQEQVAPVSQEFKDELMMSGVAYDGDTRYSVQQSSDGTFRAERIVNGQREDIQIGLPDIETAQNVIINSVGKEPTQVSVAAAQPVQEVTPEKPQGMSVEEGKSYLEERNKSTIFGYPTQDIMAMQQGKQVGRAIPSVAPAEAPAITPAPVEEAALAEEPTVKISRGEDFSMDGEYNVSIGDKKYRIYKDSESGYWYDAGVREDAVTEGKSSQGNPWLGLLSTETRKDAIAGLVNKYKKETPAPAVSETITPKASPVINERIFSEDYTGPRYTYGLRNRPLDIGTAPKGYIIGSNGPAVGRARNGTIQYPRQLTKDEIYDYELEVMEEIPATPAGFDRTDIGFPSFNSLDDYAKNAYRNGTPSNSGVTKGFIETPDNYFVDPAQLPVGAVVDEDLQGYAYSKEDGKVGYIFIDLDGVAKSGIAPDELVAKVKSLSAAEPTAEVAPIQQESGINEVLRKAENAATREEASQIGRDFAELDPSIPPPPSIQYEIVKAISNKADRRGYNPDVLTEENIKSAKESGLLTKTKIPKLTETGRNLVEDGDRAAKDREIIGGDITDRITDQTVGAWDAKNNPDSAAFKAKIVAEPTAEVTSAPTEFKFAKEIEAPRENIKKNMIRFASGMSAISDLKTGTYARGGFKNYGVGFDVGLLSKNAIDSLAASVINLDTQVFIDSGAFSNFRKSLKEQVAGRTVEALDFDKIFEKYDLIIDAIDKANPEERTDYPRPLMVMPDIIGDQKASLDLIEKYKDRIAVDIGIQTFTPIIPIPLGELSLSQAYNRILQILNSNTRGVEVDPTNFIVGIPSNAKAVSKEDLANFLRESKPPRIHFLGAAADRNITPLIETVAQNSPETAVTADASKVRSAILNGVAKGKTRKQAIFDALYQEEDPEVILNKVSKEASKPETAPTPVTPGEPEGISIGSRIKLGRSPQTYVVEEAIPQTKIEKANNEQSYSVKNERTGEVQVVEKASMKQVGGKRARKMFAGERAEMPQFRRDSLDAARAMAAAGKTTEEIRAVTGWFPGKYDGKMRWEIPDQNAKLTTEKFLRNAGETSFESLINKTYKILKNQGDTIIGKLSDILDHKELYDSYPGLKNIEVTIAPLKGNKYGQFIEEKPRTEISSGNPGKIEINAKNFPKDLRSTLLHEIQHAIQRNEGFARGASPRTLRNTRDKQEAADMALGIKSKMRDPAYKNFSIEEIQRQTSNKERKDLWPLAKELVSKTDKELRKLTSQKEIGYEGYRKVAGEIEAREIQARRDLTPEQLASMAPYSSENIAPEDAIVIQKSEEAAQQDEVVTLINEEDNANVLRLNAQGASGNKFHETGFKRFPGIVVTRTNSETLTSHPLYNAAKKFNNVEAAKIIVDKFVDDQMVFDVFANIDQSKPAYIVPVLKGEGDSLNMLPIALAEKLSAASGIPVWGNLIQATSGQSTGAGVNEKTEISRKFMGEAPPTGSQIIIVDDYLATGRTIASLENMTGTASAVSTIASGRYGNQYGLTTQRAEKLLEKAGITKERFYEIYGLQPEQAITGVEAQTYILNGTAGESGLTSRFPVEKISPSNERIRNIANVPEAIELFAGGGLFALGVRGIARPGYVVEADQRIAEFYEEAHGVPVIQDYVQNVNFSGVKSGHLQASPVCKNFSGAKNKNQITEADIQLDKTAADSVSRAIEDTQPNTVSIENVKQYKGSDSYNSIIATLEKNGYIYDANIYKANEFGAPTSRERLIVRAVKKGGVLPEIKKTNKRVSWYDSVKDIVNDLPNHDIFKFKYPAKLMQTLERKGIDLFNVREPLLISGMSEESMRWSNEPAFTFLASPRNLNIIALPGGIVKKVTARAMARMTGVPDSFPLPENEVLAKTIIGNGIPPALTRSVIGDLIIKNQKPEVAVPNVTAEKNQYTFDAAEKEVTKFFGEMPEGIVILNNATDPDLQFKAGYDVKTGDIIINLAYINNSENIGDIISHELGHFIFGDPQFQAAFQEFWDTMTPEKKAEADKVISQFYNNETGTIQVEEKQVRAFMQLIQDSKAMPRWKQLLDSIKRWINKKLGTNFQVTDRGALAVLAAAHKRFKSGKQIIREIDSGVLKTADTAQDAEYLAAVERGDSGNDNLRQLLQDAPQAERKATADAWLQRNPVAAAELQRVVDAAAKKAGFNIKAIHGTPTNERIDVFGRRGELTGMSSALKAFFFSDSKDVANTYRFQNRPDPNENQINTWIDSLSDEELSKIIPAKWGISKDDPQWMRYSAKKESLNFTNEMGEDIYYAIDELIDSAKLNNIQFPLELDQDNIGQTIPVFLNISNPYKFGYDEFESEGINQIVNQVIEGGFDGGISTERIPDVFAGTDNKNPPSGIIKFVFDPNQIKSAAPVTYDDAGNVIPLSQRLRPTSPDIRRMAVEPRRVQVAGRERGDIITTPEGIIKQTNEVLRNKFFDGSVVSDENTSVAWNYIEQLLDIKSGAAYALAGQINNAVDVETNSDTRMGAGLFSVSLANYAAKLAAQGDRQMLTYIVRRINLMPTDNRAGGATLAGRVLRGRREYDIDGYNALETEGDSKIEITAGALFGTTRPSKEQVKVVQDAIDESDNTSIGSPEEVSGEIEKVEKRTGRKVIKKIEDKIKESTELKKEELLISFQNLNADKKIKGITLTYNPQKISPVKSIQNFIIGKLVDYRKTLINQGASGLESTFWQTMSDQERKPGPLGEIDQAQNNELAKIVQKTLIDLNLKGEPPDTKMTDIEKVASILNKQKLSEEKRIEADQRIVNEIERRRESELESGSTPEAVNAKYDTILDAWNQAMSRQLNMPVSDNMLQRLINAELKEQNTKISNLIEEADGKAAAKTKQGIVDSVIRKIYGVSKEFETGIEMDENYDGLKGYLEQALDNMYALQIEKKNAAYADRQAKISLRNNVEGQAQSIINQLADQLSDTPAFPEKQENQVKSIVQQDLGQNPDMKRKQPWTSQLTAKLMQIGVSEIQSEIISNLVWRQHEIKAMDRELKELQVAAESGSLAVIIQRIKSTPIEKQQSKNWMQGVIKEYLIESGLSNQSAETAARLYESVISERFAEAKQKAFQGVLNKSAPWQNYLSRNSKLGKQALSKIQDAIRTGVLDPTQTTEDIVAKENGWSGFTKEQFTRIVQLDGIISDDANNEITKAEAISELNSIIVKVKMPVRFKDAIGAYYVAQALMGIPTFLVNVVSPVGFSVRNMITDVGKYSLTEPSRIPMALESFLDSMKSWYNQTSYAFKNQIYMNDVVEYLQGQNTLRELFDKGKAQWAKGEYANGMANMLVGMTQITGRVLSALDQGSISALENQNISRYAMEAMKHNKIPKNKRKEFANMILHIRKQTYAENVSNGMSGDRAGVLADLAVRQEIKVGLSELGIRDDVLNSALNDALQTVGRNRTLDTDKLTGVTKKLSDAGILSYFPISFLDKIASGAAQEGPGMQVFSKMLYGFALVPARVFHTTAWYSPYGFVRFAVDKFQRDRGYESSYAMSLQTELQYKQRLTDTIAGSIIMLGLAAIVSSSTEDDEDKPFKLIITGNGPSYTADRQYYDAWNKKYKPYSLHIVMGDTVIPINIGRGGEALFFPIMLAGALDDWNIKKKLNLTKKDPKELTLATEALGSAFFALAQRGPYSAFTKPLFDATKEGKITEELVGQVGFFGKTFIPIIGSSLSRNISDFINDPVDRSSLAGAIYANTPIVGPWIGTKALNALGQPMRADDWGDRLFKLGVPVVFSFPKNTPENELNELILKKGSGPSIPTRSNAQTRYGDALTDKEFEIYVREYGRVVSDKMFKNRKKLENMSVKNYDDELEGYVRGYSVGDTKITGASDMAVRAVKRSRNE